MLTLASLILDVIAGLLSIPVLVLLIEVIGAFPAPKERPSEEANLGNRHFREKSAVIIVPAHNESTGILPTIEDIKPQLTERDRVLVVADNCSDDTAAVAASAGVEVTQRNNPDRIGKGYALDWGIQHLNADPPDFVIFIDADCRIQSDMIGRLKEVCDRLQRPVQATFLMTTPKDSPVDNRVAEFAWIVKNWVRPLGLRYFNCPVQLMGTGMIFPWDVVRSVSIATENLVEDMKLGLDLAAMGKAPQFYPFVIGVSYFPSSIEGVYSQRQRWEHGHIGMIKMAPRMLLLAIRRLNIHLLVLTLDLIVPPLALLGLLIAGMLVFAALSALLGLSYTALIISVANLAAYTLAVGLAWSRFGRAVLPSRAIWSIASYVFGKLRLYGQILSGRTVGKWIRTDRGASK